MSLTGAYHIILRGRCIVNDVFVDLQHPQDSRCVYNALFGPYSTQIEGIEHLGLDAKFVQAGSSMLDVQLRRNRTGMCVHTYDIYIYIYMSIHVCVYIYISGHVHESV